MNKNIKHVFESFSPPEERKQEIYESIMKGQKSEREKGKLPFPVKLVYAMGACLILAALAAALLSGPAGESPASSPGSDITYQASRPSENSATPAPTEKSSVFNGFVLTAYTSAKGAEYLGASYAEENKKAVLTPDVKILLAKYDPSMSSVPGYPFTVDITTEADLDAITVSADAGTLCKWDRETGVVSPEGYITSIGKGETIYWSPIGNGTTSDVINITVTFEAVIGDAVVGRQNIYITQVKPGCYYATVGELELV